MTYSIGLGTAGKPLKEQSLAFSSVCSVQPCNYPLMQPTQTISSAKTLTWSAISIMFFVVGHYNFIILTVVTTDLQKREGGRGKKKYKYFSHLFINASPAADSNATHSLIFLLPYVKRIFFFKPLNFFTSAFSVLLWSFQFALHLQFSPSSTQQFDNEHNF